MNGSRFTEDLEERRDEPRRHGESSLSDVMCLQYYYTVSDIEERGPLLWEPDGATTLFKVDQDANCAKRNVGGSQPALLAKNLFKSS